MAAKRSRPVTRPVKKRRAKQRISGATAKTRAARKSAIARKKNTGTVVDSIVADDIASFPDKNVGEAMARITGVQLSRDFGEGTQVSIRGIEPDLNRIEINGVSQSSSSSRSTSTRGIRSI